MFDVIDIELNQINLFLLYSIYICTYVENILNLAPAAQQAATSVERPEFRWQNQQNSQYINKATRDNNQLYKDESRLIFWALVWAMLAHKQLLKQLLKALIEQTLMQPNNQFPKNCLIDQ